MIYQLNRNDIILRYRRGESKRSIARETGLDRKTVAKYCNQYDELTKKFEKGMIDEKEYFEQIASKPAYDTKRRRSTKYTQEIDALLDKILESEAEKAKVLGSHKQKLTAVQIHQIIVDEGHDIGKSTISKKLKEKRHRAKECFIHQAYDLGDRLEFDFGEVKLVIDGKVSKYFLAVLSSPAGQFRWAYLYNNQKKEVFQNAHIRFFEMMGGAHREVVYDNMKNVVKRFLGKNEKELNQDLINMSLYYGFEINVTNAFRGNEKGHVEGSVKIIRNEAFTKQYEFKSLEAANDHLERTLIEHNKESLMEAEKSHLKAYRPPLDLANVYQVTINTYSYARVLKNSYSVPDYLVGKQVKAKVYHDEIEFYSNHYFVCSHKKIDGSNAFSTDIRHYLRTFKKKPGAIRNSLALKSIPQLKSIYDVYFSARPKKFIELLEKYQDLELEELAYHIKDEILFKEPLEKDESIELITQSQLNLYNHLSLGRTH